MGPDGASNAFNRQLAGGLRTGTRREPHDPLELASFRAPGQDRAQSPELVRAGARRNDLVMTAANPVTGSVIPNARNRRPAATAEYISLNTKTPPMWSHTFNPG